MRILDCHWLPIKDGDPRAATIYRRHYSCYQYKDKRRDRYGYRNRFLIVGPGEKMLLMTVDCNALFAWRKFIDRSGQVGVNCAIFRNESPILSSELILEAEQHAWQRWPGARLYTYVKAAVILSSNPGYCYLKAGWNKCGETKSGLLILEKLPCAPIASLC